MTCWHCNEELILDFTTENFEKFYHCANCDKWYEMSKEKVKINGAVPVKFVELEYHPQFSAASGQLSV
jgi:transcription elongation factor Elf1